MEQKVLSGGQSGWPTGPKMMPAERRHALPLTPERSSQGDHWRGMAARGRMSLHLKTGVKKAVAVCFEFQPFLPNRSHALVLFASLEGEAVPVIEGSPLPVTTSQDRGQ